VLRATRCCHRSEAASSVSMTSSQDSSRVEQAGLADGADASAREASVWSHLDHGREVALAVAPGVTALIVRSITVPLKKA